MDTRYFICDIYFQDKHKLDEYFESVRQIETQIEKPNKYYTMNELPIVVAGSANGRLKTGGIFNCPRDTPLANLWLLQARLMGAGLKRFADSTGPLDSLLV